MKDSNGDLTYFLTDHLGSVVAITDDQGDLISQQRYLPFGGVRTIPNSPITNTDFGYTGQRNLDDDIGLMDYKARFYSPVLNRFIQPDTIVPNMMNPQMFNRFSYVGNNPINFNDPTGHLTCDADGFCDQNWTINQQGQTGKGSGKNPGKSNEEPGKGECHGVLCSPAQSNNIQNQNCQDTIMGGEVCEWSITWTPGDYDPSVTNVIKEFLRTLDDSILPSELVTLIGAIPGLPYLLGLYLALEGQSQSDATDFGQNVTRYIDDNKYTKMTISYIYTVSATPDGLGGFQNNSSGVMIFSAVNNNLPESYTLVTRGFTAFRANDWFASLYGE